MIGRPTNGATCLGTRDDFFYGALASSFSLTLCLGFTIRIRQNLYVTDRDIISLNAGVSKVESKVRGDAAVPAAMIKWVESRVDSMKDTPYMVAYTSSTAKRDELVKLCKKAFGHAPLIVFQLGGVVSANTGPDGIAIVYEGKPRNLEAYAPELP